MQVAHLGITCLCWLLKYCMHELHALQSSCHCMASGSASKKRQSRSLFDESQTEYVKIPSAVKRPCVLTDRQKEVLMRQKAGESWPTCLTESARAHCHENTVAVLHELNAGECLHSLV